MKNETLFYPSRKIDNWLRSIPKQVIALTALCISVFVILCATSWLVKKESDFINWMLAFINPGSTEATESAIDRIIALIIGFFGMVLLNGFLISIFNNILQRRIDKISNGQVAYRFSGHILIIGYNKMAISIIQQVCKDAEIVLQTTSNAPDVRHELYALLDKKAEKNITIVLGSRTSKEDLEKLRPAHCEKIIILGENSENDHDAKNIRCVELIRDILKETAADKSIKRCHVLFEYQSTYAIFQRQDIPGMKDYIDFVPFNFYESWAQKLFADNPLDKAGIDYDSEKTVHLVIAGMARMGVALGIQASHLCHFPNFVKDKTKKTRITFIDEYADREMNFLKGRYVHLFDEIDYSYTDIEHPEKNEPKEKSHAENKEIFTDIEWHFVKGKIEHPEIRKSITAWSNEPNSLLTIAVCFKTPAKSIAAGLYLPDAVYDNQIRVCIRQETSHSILSVMEATERFRNVLPFGMMDNACNLENADDVLPMRVNYVYSYYYEHQKQPDSIPPEQELADLWRTLKTSKKWSNRYNANALRVKQRSFNIGDGQLIADDITIERLARVEHNRWSIEELLLGYRPATPEEKREIGSSQAKKNELKTRFIHNDICPFDQIVETDDKKVKDPKEYDICLSKAIPLILEHQKSDK
ncbi:MAG: NAD-binding protein [Prevotella sp.]|nr:NAD-binding protein [Prevotella sp.]